MYSFLNLLFHYFCTFLNPCHPCLIVDQHSRVLAVHLIYMSDISCTHMLIETSHLFVNKVYSYSYFPKVRTCYARPRKFRNFLMLSEWLVDVPEDFSHSYLAVPCPVGKRCLVMSSKVRFSPHWSVVKNSRCLFSYAGQCLWFLASSSECCPERGHSRNIFPYSVTFFPQIQFYAYQFCIVITHSLCYSQHSCYKSQW